MHENFEVIARLPFLRLAAAQLFKSTAVEHAMAAVIRLQPTYAHVYPSCGYCIDTGGRGGMGGGMMPGMLMAGGAGLLGGALIGGAMADDGGEDYGGDEGGDF